MKNYLIIVFVLMVAPVQNLLAQQNTASFISNTYIQSANLLSTVNALGDYRTLRNLPAGIPMEITGNSAYYKIAYQPTGASNYYWGLVDIQCANSNGSTATIEKIVDSYYRLFSIDDDEDEYITEFVKNPTVHGGYFFNKNRNIIYVYMISMPARKFAAATIEINNLSMEQKKAFARDFINKTIFL